MEAVTIYYSIINCGDGSAENEWFITKEAAKERQSRQYGGWSESCIGSVETFVHSKTYNEALYNENENIRVWKAEDDLSNGLSICKECYKSVCSEDYHNDLNLCSDCYDEQLEEK